MSVIYPALPFPLSQSPRLSGRHPFLLQTDWLLHRRGPRFGPRWYLHFVTVAEGVRFAIYVLRAQELLFRRVETE
eukprot:scaffold17174_cov79-Skeletonema_dohrnii-CCMP3373.AAC.1